MHTSRALKRWAMRKTEQRTCTTCISHVSTVSIKNKQQ